MKVTIVEKINKVISKGLDSEPDVLYVLAQIRKYLETVYSRDESFKIYPTISLFCDWVLHAKLDRSGAKRTLEEYADFFAQQQGNGIFEFLKNGLRLFVELKRELVLVCKEAGFNEEITFNRTVWLYFISNLVEILKDLPLISTGEIYSFTFRDNIADLDGTKLISFEIKFRNERNIHSSIDLELLDYQNNY